MFEHHLHLNPVGFHSITEELDPKILPNVIKKEYGPAAGGFDPAHAAQIAYYMRRFVEIAKRIGFPAVESIGHVISKNGHDGKVNLVEFVPYAGPNLLEVIGDQTVNNDFSGATKSFREYLGLIGGVWAAGHDISPDPPLTNFCKNKKGKISYVDLMPPRQRLPDGKYIAEWPTPHPEDFKFTVDRYFTPAGQTKVIYAQSLRALLPLGFDIDTIRQTMVTTLGSEAEQNVVIGQQERQRLLYNHLPTDVDHLRALAAEAYGTKQIDKETFEKVYKLCHIGIGSILPKIEDVRAASALLRN